MLSTTFLSERTTLNKYQAVVRQCPGCRKVLLAEMFYKQERNNDGLSIYCKSCTVSRNKVYTELHPDVNKRASKKWRDINKEKTHKNKKEYGKNNREKLLAQNTARRAVKSGKITRPNKCQFCGKECVPDGHHEDYSLPLAVIWLCRKCHKAITKDKI